MSKEEIAKLVAQLETDMRAAARELDFERAAAMRDEIRDIRLRVLEQDQSVIVARAAERAGAAAASAAKTPTAKPSERAAALKSGLRRGRRAVAAGEAAGPGLEVTSVTVLEAGEEPTLREPDLDTASDWLPGIRDEHEGDDAGWMARWLEKPTWDSRVTPNVVKRTGERPSQRGRGRGGRRYK
jgi:hypothetical protein